MFGIGSGEFIALLLLALVLVGPNRLPKVSSDVARLIKRVQVFARSATIDLRENLGPGYEDLNVADLHPKKLISKHLTEVLNETKSEIETIKKSAKIDPDLL